jgi:hypothetical protein
MNFKNKTEIIRFSRCVVFPLVPPLSHFAARAGMRGRQRIWDSEGKKEEKKGEIIISVLGPHYSSGWFFFTFCERDSK